MIDWRLRFLGVLSGVDGSRGYVLPMAWVCNPVESLLMGIASMPCHIYPDRAHYDFDLTLSYHGASLSADVLVCYMQTVRQWYKRCKGNNGNPAYIILLCYI